MADSVAAPARQVHVEHCMGTVFSIDVRDPGDWRPAFRTVVRWLHQVDRLFSTYRPDSDVSRLRRGELTVADADPLVGDVLALCGQLSAATGGYFDAHWRGAVDPTGLVKGWAVERASELLADRGSRNHCVNGGGDVRARGGAGPDRLWGVGISDPLDRTRLLAVVTGRDLAVATSGPAERGPHIVDPHTGTPATDLAGVTVVGPDLTHADTYATAAVAMGRRALAWLEAEPGYEGLTVSPTGTVARTSAFPG